MPKSRKHLVLVIVAILIVAGFLGSLVESLASGDVAGLTGQLILFGILGFFLYRNRDRLNRQRRVYQEKFEQAPGDVPVQDAALFSLAWSKEIYENIPEDRRSLVKQAFWLIGAGLGVVLLQMGWDSITTVLIVAALVAAGVNLLIWVVSYERSERDDLRVQMEAARRMQDSLMPEAPPTLPGYDLAGCCLPAKVVGGDTYDYAWMGGEHRRLACAVADVAGKGIDAAMTAMFTSGAFVSEIQHEADPAQVMNNLNFALRTRNTRSRFVSFLLAVLDVDARTIDIVNAGQSKPLLYRDGEALTLESQGIHFPLGVVDGVAYESRILELKPGDRLLFSTDGVSEAMNPAREVFGEERLRAAFVSACAAGGDARTVTDRLRTALIAHQAGAEQHDDITMIVLFLPEGAR